MSPPKIRPSERGRSGKDNLFMNNTITAAKSMQEKYYKDFSITSVCRADLEEAGFDVTNVDDDDMKELASKMANAYCDMIFWADLKILAEYLGIKKTIKSKNK